MRSKAPLALMELVVMVLVFALSAALCLRIFVLSDRISRSCEDRDNALILAQTAAETVKHYGGDLPRAAAALGGAMDGEVLTLRSDDLNLVITPAEGSSPLLGLAAVTVYNGAGETVFSFDIAWQEADSNE